MRRSGLAALAVLISALPAAGVGVGIGADGGIHVEPDFTGCASVTFASALPFAGTFTAVGEMQGPGTKAATIRSTIPVSGVGTWSGCISGGYAGASTGEAKYVLEASSDANEIVRVTQCVVNMGTLTCTD